MWTDVELEELSVWADDLQQRGDPWGELVATSLAAEANELPGHRARLEQRVTDLEREVLEPRVRPILDGCAGIRPIWEYGVMVGLRVTGPGRDSSEAMLERVAELLRLPAARFLWSLRVDLWVEYRHPKHHEVIPLLLGSEVVARPRVVILGTPPRHTRGQRPATELEQPIVEPSRGLLGLVVDQVRVELPWTRGDGGSRVQAFARLDARIRSDPGRLSTRDQTLLARALWDRSARVRLHALDCLGELGVAAAPFVPDLRGVHRVDPRWRERADAVLAKLGQQGEVVTRVARNFIPEQVGALRWLRSVDGLDARSVERIAAMSRDREGLPGWLSLELLRTHQRFFPTPDPEPAPMPAIAIGGRTWLQRMRSWLVR